MRTDLFDYSLPKDRIAQTPVRPRDHSRLLALDRATGKWTHHHFYDIGTFLRPGDLLVVNESRVFRARLKGRVAAQNIELFLLRPRLPIAEAYKHGVSYKDNSIKYKDNSIKNPTVPLNAPWLALAKPARKIAAGTTIVFDDGGACDVVSKRNDGTVIVDFHASATDVVAWTEKIGAVPTPPYIANAPPSADDYQTVYAKTVGSVAAPTAGFHFTPELISHLKRQGVVFATVTLHVGLGTFRPIKTETLEAHEMHEEWIEVPEETRHLIQKTKETGHRVIAVGTTTVRALESDIDNGLTKLFITPGYRFKTVDGLITNFHLPKSTLLVLVSAFVGAGREDADWGRRTALASYEDAIKQGYRFYSFGDAMLII